MNHRTFVLQKQAIEHAKKGEWEQAVEKNKEILSLLPADIPALNRLGFCYIQLQNVKEAKKTYQQVLEIDRLNSVAKKYLTQLDKKGVVKVKNIASVRDFIEEPGKSRVVLLDRLSGAESLNHLPVASALVLKLKGRFITVNTEEGEYIGSLPEDISFHLASLMKTGNEYVCVLRSASKHECSVFIRETYRSPQNQNVPSFFYNTKKQIGEVDEDLILGEMIDETLTEDVVTEEEPEKTPEDDDVAQESKENIPSDILSDVGSE